MKMTKTAWENIGKQARWMKEAQANNKEYEIGLYHYNGQFMPKVYDGGSEVMRGSYYDSPEAALAAAQNWMEERDFFSEDFDPR